MLKQFLFACLSTGLFVSPTRADSSRRTISLDGRWQVAEGSLNAKPAQFDHEVPIDR